MLLIGYKFAGVFPVTLVVALTLDAFVNPSKDCNCPALVKSTVWLGSLTANVMVASPVDVEIVSVVSPAVAKRATRSLCVYTPAVTTTEVRAPVLLDCTTVCVLVML